MTCRPHPRGVAMAGRPIAPRRTHDLLRLARTSVSALGTSGERRPACDRRVQVDPAGPDAPLTTQCLVPTLLPEKCILGVRRTGEERDGGHGKPPDILRAPRVRLCRRRRVVRRANRGNAVDPGAARRYGLAPTWAARRPSVLTPHTSTDRAPQRSSQSTRLSDSTGVHVAHAHRSCTRMTLFFVTS